METPQPPPAESAPARPGALLAAVLLLAGTSTYTTLAVAIFLTHQHAPGWEVWLAAMPAALLAVSVALALALAARQRRPER
jgi:hypothetical protein